MYLGCRLKGSVSIGQLQRQREEQSTSRRENCNTTTKEKMGNCSSSPNSGVQDSRKFVYILYNSLSKTHKHNTKAFKDALKGGSAGSSFVINLLDVNEKRFDSIKWVRKVNHLILLSVDQQGARSLSDSVGTSEWIRERDLDGAKILSISFGTTPPQQMIDILNHRGPGTDQKDFCFGFQDTSDLAAIDFDKSPVMKELVTSLKAS